MLDGGQCNAYQDNWLGQEGSNHNRNQMVFDGSSPSLRAVIERVVFMLA
jgi:hypothetical protein